MKTKIYFLLFALLTSSIITAQKLEKIDTLTYKKMESKEEGKNFKMGMDINVYVASDKNSYKIGDTLVLGNPTKHFVYQYHFAKELADELKKRDINEVTCIDKELQLRLKFYNIVEGEKYFLSTRSYYNYDERIVIRYYNKELLDVYVKKIEK